MSKVKWSLAGIASTVFTGCSEKSGSDVAAQIQKLASSIEQLNDFAFYLIVGAIVAVLAIGGIGLFVGAGIGSSARNISEIDYEEDEYE